MAIVGFDWFGPMTLTYTITGAVYILLMIDYFSWFLGPKAYTKHIAQEVVDLHKNHVSSVFGHFQAMYTDNESYFINQIMNDYYRDRRTMRYTKPISHLSSTGLFDKVVQGLITFLRTKNIECRTTDAWSLHIREEVLFSNIKDANNHRYAPAGILLGFTPQMIYFDISTLPLPDCFEAKIEEASYNNHRIFMVPQDEKKCFASEATAYTYYVKGIQERWQKIPELDDLVLVRNHAVDSQREWKLEAKLPELRILLLYLASKLTAYVCEVYSNNKTRKNHINNTLLYPKRNGLFVDGVRPLVRLKDTIPTVIEGKEIEEIKR